MRLFGSTWSPELAFQFANAFEFVVLCAAAAVLLYYIVGQVASWGDLWRRFSRVILHNYQGGGYDLAIACFAILFGKAMRAGIIWEWRHFGGQMSLDLLLVAVAIVAAGSLCLVRVLVPCRYYNCVWIGVGIVALAFAGWSVSVS
jgi:hypothetical protein